MKYKGKLFLFSCAALVLSFVLFRWIDAQCYAPIPEASHPAGYYPEAFHLKLSAPSNGKIYYTLDGSLPTLDSPEYQGGILLQDRSPEENHYNAAQNIVTDWKQYTPDPTPVPKGTVVRAMYVNDQGFQSDVFTQTYFVGLKPPERGYTLSLIFEPESVFGSNGLYVTGTEYDEWYLSGNSEAPEPIPNFRKTLEVPVIAELLDRSGDVMHQQIGLQLQGASMRGAYKKRFKLVAREEYSGSQLFDTAVFGDIKPHSVMLKYNTTDAIVSELTADRFVSTQRSVPVRVFLNGEYWYDTYMLERYDSQYFQQHYNVKNRELVKDSVSDLDPSYPTENPDFMEFLHWVGHTDFSDEAQWEQLLKEMDIQSYIDFISINYYLCNCDFAEDKNYLFWRSINKEDAPMGDCRWRWCIYDIDAIDFNKPNFDVDNPAEINIFSCDLPYIDGTVCDSLIFHSLFLNDTFRHQFVLSFQDIVNNNFSPDKVQPVLEQHGLSLDWNDGFFRKRPAYAMEHLAQTFRLTGTLETVTLSTKIPEMGTLQVNTSGIDLSSGSWSGQYFTDYPITITAQPKDGYRFVGWKGDENTTLSTLIVPVDGGLTLEAVFEKES